MSEWTTISVTEDTKNTLDDVLPPGRSWDERLYKTIGELGDSESNESGSDPLDGLEDRIEEAIPETQADVDVDTEELARNLSKKLGSDVEMSAYRGTKEAIEETLR